MPKPLHVRVRVYDSATTDEDHKVLDTDPAFPPDKPGDRLVFGARDALAITADFLTRNLPAGGEGFTPGHVLGLYNSIQTSLSSRGAAERTKYTVYDGKRVVTTHIYLVAADTAERMARVELDATAIGPRDSLRGFTPD